MGEIIWFPKPPEKIDFIRGTSVEPGRGLKEKGAAQGGGPSCKGKTKKEKGTPKRFPEKEGSRER